VSKCKYADEEHGIQIVCARMMTYFLHLPNTVPHNGKMDKWKQILRANIYCTLST